MRTTTIRELKHHTRLVLGWVEAGETVELHRRGKPVALLVPPERRDPPDLPDFTARMKEIYGDTVLPTAGSELVSEARGSR